MKVLVIYHNDLDGECSAAITKKYLNGKYSHIRFIYRSYPAELPKNIEDYDICYILDFCFSVEDMVSLSNKMKVVWIDHHITSIQKMGSLLNNTYLDTNKSACLLTWEYFYDDEEPPLPVQYINDLDLYQNLDREGVLEFKEFSRLFNTSPISDIWKKWLSPVIDIEYLGKEQGKYIILYKEAMLDDAITNLGEATKIDGYSCMKINWSDSHTSSSLGSKITKDYDIAWLYRIQKDGTIYNSLYSSKNKDIDVSKIAVRYGGGGHKSAAGFITYNE